MKQVKNLLLVFSVAFLIMSLGVVSSSEARKKHHCQTPAEDTVCDGQVGAAFGLCNAYCEAMDCDSKHPHACKKACERVLNLYVKETGLNPPCIAPILSEYEVNCNDGIDDDGNGLIDYADPACMD